MNKVEFDSFSYIIDDKFNICDYSKQTKAVFPNVEKNAKCYCALRGINAPCDDCPIVKNDPTSQVQVMSKENQKKYNIAFSNVCDDNKYLIVGSHDCTVNENEFRAFVKSEIYNRASYNGAFGYFVIDLNDDVFVSNFYEVVDLVESINNIDGIYGMTRPYSFSTFTRWRLEKRVISNRYEYESMVNSKALLELYNSGKDFYEIHYDSYSSGGYPAYHIMTFNLRKDETNGHILALCIIRDVTVKRKKEAEHKLVAQINNTILDRFTSVFVLETETNEIRAFKVDHISADVFNLKPGAMYTYSSTVNNFITNTVSRDDIVNARKISDTQYILGQLKTKKSFSQLLRLDTEDGPKYFEFLFSKINDEAHARQVVIAVSNVDQAIKLEREQQQKLEQAVQMAQNDALTGVKNRTAYDMTMQKYNDDIQNREKLDFAIAMFDINFLKPTNDMYGHEAGDKLIVRSAKLICDVFAHSPVFRIGGDEFVAILTGKDYKNRDELMFKFRSKTKEMSDANIPSEQKVSIACGLATYYPSVDKSFSSVATRADSAMYQNKNDMKEDSNDN